MSDISTISSLPLQTTVPVSQRPVPKQPSTATDAATNAAVTPERAITAESAALTATAATSRAQEAQKVSAPEQAKAEPSAEELKQITEELQRRVSIAAPELHFSVDKESGKSIVKIMDPSTKEVIRQIPSEEMLKLSQSIDKFQQGLLLNGQA